MVNFENRGNLMNKIINKINTVAMYIASMSVIIILLISSIDYNCFHREFYMQEYERLNTAQELGVTQKDLNLATDVLLDYLEDHRHDIKVKITIQGQLQDAFNVKEEAHMEDVKRLYHFALVIRNIAFVMFGISVILLAVRLKKSAWTELSISYMKTTLIFVIFFALLVTWVYVDFDAFWIMFHKILFRNDLWLLDPAKDFMVNLFPDAFFAKLVKNIAIFFIVGILGLFVASYAYLHHRLKMFQKEEDMHEIK